MQTILNLVLAAYGTPSDVRARLSDQVIATAQATEQAPIVAAARTFLEEKIKGLSEDEMISVTANISIVVTDPPALIVQRRADEQEAQAKEIRTREATIASREKEIAQLKTDLEAARQPKDTPPDIPQV